jgi:hypothetical protein
MTNSIARTAREAGHGPQCDRVAGRVGADPGVVGFPGGVDDGELDDLVQQAAPLAGGQPVGVGDGGELPGPVFRGRQVLDPGDDVVVQLGVEPGQLGQLDERVDRPGGFPVDEGDGHAVPGDDVPRRGVADHRVAAPVDDVPAAAFEQDRVIGRGHGSLCSWPALTRE